MGDDLWKNLWRAKPLIERFWTFPCLVKFWSRGFGSEIGVKCWDTAGKIKVQHIPKDIHVISRRIRSIVRNSVG